MGGFHWLDYVLFVVMLVASLGIGVYAALTGGKQRTTREFLIGNRELTLLPVFVSFVMSYTSGKYIFFLSHILQHWRYWVYGHVGIVTTRG